MSDTRPIIRCCGDCHDRLPCGCDTLPDGEWVKAQPLLVNGRVPCRHCGAPTVYPAVLRAHGAKTVACGPCAQRHAPRDP